MGARRRLMEIRNNYNKVIGYFHKATVIKRSYKKGGKEYEYGYVYLHLPRELIGKEVFVIAMDPSYFEYLFFGKLAEETKIKVYHEDEKNSDPASSLGQMQPRLLILSRAYRIGKRKKVRIWTKLRSTMVLKLACYDVYGYA